MLGLTEVQFANQELVDVSDMKVLTLNEVNPCDVLFGRSIRLHYRKANAPCFGLYNRVQNVVSLEITLITVH